MSEHESSVEDENRPQGRRPRRGPRAVRSAGLLPREFAEVEALVARKDDVSQWFAGDADALERCLRAAAAACAPGLTTEANREILSEVYRAGLEVLPVEARRTFLIETWKEVAGGAVDCWVLWMIAIADTHPLLVAMATECFACLRAEMDCEAMTVAGYFLDSFDSLKEATRAGVFHGLLAMGDPEVLERLRPCRWELTDAEVFMICSLPFEGSDVGVHQFLHEWLEETLAAQENARARAIAAALTVDAGGLETMAREGGPSAMTVPSSSLRHNGPCLCIPVRELAARMEARLRVLAVQEVGWPAVPTILEGWGLSPRRDTN